MEINSTEKEQNMKNNITEVEKEQSVKNDSNSIDSVVKNKNIIPSNQRNSEETHFSSENKSISAERPDKSDEKNQNTQSKIKNNNTKNKVKSFKITSSQKEINIPHKFNNFLERNEGFQKRKKENMNELHKNYEANLKKIMKETPEITKKSRLIDKKNSKQKFLDRIKEQEIQQKLKKEKLFQKINNEKAKKKEAIEKPLEFNIKLKEDKKFMKIYEQMLARQKEVKERFKIFNDVIQEYNMKECTFSPKINKDKNKKEENSENGSDCSNDNDDINEKVVNRLYKDEIKYRNKLKENLFNKYKPSFQPKINQNAEKLSRNWKNKLYSKNRTQHFDMKNYKTNASPAKKRMNKSSCKKEQHFDMNNYKTNKSPEKKKMNKSYYKKERKINDKNQNNN